MPRTMSRDPSDIIMRAEPDDRTQALSQVCGKFLREGDMHARDEDYGWSFYLIAETVLRDCDMDQLGGWGGTTFAHVFEAEERLRKLDNNRGGYECALADRLSAIVGHMHMQTRFGDSHGVGDWRK